MRILVVGAGPTGLTAAVELARRGIIADVIDKRGEASGFSRAVGILPVSLQLLEPSGVTELLLSEGIKFKSVAAYQSARKIFGMEFSVKEVSYGHDYILGLAQDRTEYHLASRFRVLGGKINYGKQIVDLRQAPGEAIAEFADGDHTAYDYILGADGARSTVRNAAGIEFAGYDLNDDWSIADVNCPDWVNPDSFSAFFLGRGNVAIVVPLETQRYRVISNTPDALNALPIPMNVTKIRREGQFNISIRQAVSYNKGRVYLAGDAAHCHSPVGGRGMNLGIADACELARRMAEDDLDGYSDIRHKEGESVVAATERARKILMSRHGVLRWILMNALRIGVKVPAIRDRISRGVLYG